MANSITTDIIIIGSGFGGLCMGIQLKRNHKNNFIILEKDAEPGGTWWVNNYPGAECDVQSHLYQYSFELNPNWNKMFGTQQEILQYTNNCIDKYNLLPHIKTNAEVNYAEYNEKEGVWLVKTKQGAIYKAQFVVTASGGLSRAAIPNIKGIKTYKGKLFHSSRWDHSFDYTNKKVAVVGSAASAVQIVPAIAPKVKQLTVFQRTPSWIIPKPDRPISSLEQQLFKLAPFTQRFYRNALYTRNELFALGFVVDHRIMKLAQPLAENFIKKTIKDKTLQQKVTPNYTLGCKRILLSSEYYPALNRENVNLITEGVNEVTPKGIKTQDGKEHEFDLIIFATGFTASEAIAPFPILGKNGITLEKAWEANGAEAFLGVSISGFPNSFLIVGPNTGLGHSSMFLMIESQVNYIIDALKTIEKKKIQSVDVKKTVQDQFNEELQKRLNKAVWGDNGGCQSWYKTKDGKNTTLWPGFTFEYMARTRFFNLNNYEVKYNNSQSDLTAKPKKVEQEYSLN